MAGTNKYSDSSILFVTIVTKNTADITAKAAPTKPICGRCPFEQTIPPIQLPAPIPKLNIPEKMDIATEDDCSSVQRIVSD